MSQYKRWPIGIQSGPTSDPQGIGNVINNLTRENIAMFSASSDSMSILFDLQYARRQSGVPHTGNYSVHGYVDDIHLEVPVYGKPHSRALAKEHWDLVEKRGLPSEIDWDMPCIWLSTWNEVRPYVGWSEAGSGEAPEDPVEGYAGNADLIGWQAVEIGLEAMARGYRWAAFGFAGGNPEPGFWQAPGVVEYLRLCHKYPDQLGIALHEYALSNTLMGNNKIGYFQGLHRACDQLGLRRPVIQIKEFGWQARWVPGPETAVPELIHAARIYMKHPNIHGAAIWTAQKHPERRWGEVYLRVQKLITPLGQAALAHAQPIPEEPELVSPDPIITAPASSHSLNGAFRASFERFSATVGLNVALEPETVFKASWELSNQGSAVWGSDFAFARSTSQHPQTVGRMDWPLEVTRFPLTDISPVMTVTPGEKVLLTLTLKAPTEPGRYATTWQLQTPDGSLFGPLCYIRVAVGDTDEVSQTFTFTHWPSESFRISQRYNVRPEEYGRFCWNGRCLTGHDGVDIAAPYNAPIYAVAAGKVERLRQADEPNNNYGNAVYIRHTDGYQTVYAHLKEINVAVNDEVTGGQVIGRAGNTGNVRPRPTPANPTAGTHLHLTLKKDGATQQGDTEQPFDIIDPTPFLELLR